MSYDAFISYSHSADGRLAPAVQSGLQRLARPWYRRTALRVFRDETGLAVNPNMWESISRAMDDSRYFVLLASPDAARSRWVDQEIRQWLSSNPPETLLPVLTEGTLAWDSESGDFDPARSSALPAALAGVFAAEPRHLDLRWARDEAQLDLRHSRFRAQIATLAAPIHGIEREELESEDIRLRRRAVRFAWMGAILLLLLTAAALASSAFAVSYANAAREERRQAELQRTRAIDNAELASQQEQVARENAAEAARQRDRATTNEQTATENAAEADLQRARAEASGAEAQRNANAAAANGAEAQTNAAHAQENAAEAAANASAAARNAAEASARAAEAQRNSEAADKAARSAAASAAEATRNAKRAAEERSIAEKQRLAAERQRLGAVSRALAFASSDALRGHEIDRGLLLAATGARFAQRAGSAVPDSQFQRLLVEALEADPSRIGWLQGLGGVVVDVAISPDGTRAAAVTSNNKVGVWDYRSLELLSTFDVPPGSRDLAFASPEDIIVTGYWDTVLGRVQRFHTSDGMHWAPMWSTPVFQPEEVAVLSDGRIAVVGTPRLVSIYDAHLYFLETTGRVIAEIQLHSDWHAFAASRSGNVAISTTASTVDIYDSRGALVQQLAIPDDMFLRSAQFAADNTRLAFLSYTQRGWEVLEYDLRTGSSSHRPLALPSESWNPFAISPTLDRVLVSDGDVLGIAAIGDSSQVDDVTTAQASGAGFGSVTFASDGSTIAIAGQDGAVPVFATDPDDPSHVARVPLSLRLRSTSNDTEVAMSESGDLLVAVTNIYGPDITAPARMDIVRVAHPEARIEVPLSRDAALRITSAVGGRVSLGADGAQAAIAFADGSVEVRSTATGALLLHLEGLPECTADPNACGFVVTSFTGSVEHGALAVTSGNVARVWNLRAGNARSSFELSSTVEAQFLRFSRDGERLVIATRDFPRLTVHVLNASGEGWLEARSFAVELGALAMSPDGRQLVDADGEHVTGYNLDTGERAWQVAGPDITPMYADAQTLITVRSTGVVESILYRSVSDGTVRFGLRPVPEALDVLAATTVANDLFVATSGYDRRTDEAELSIGVWPTAISDLVKIACTQANRNLTRSEWSQFVGTIDAYAATCPDLPSG